MFDGRADRGPNDGLEIARRLSGRLGGGAINGDKPRIAAVLRLVPVIVPKRRSLRPHVYRDGGTRTNQIRPKARDLVSANDLLQRSAS